MLQPFLYAACAEAHFLNLGLNCQNVVYLLALDYNLIIVLLVQGYAVRVLLCQLFQHLYVHYAVPAEVVAALRKPAGGHKGIYLALLLAGIAGLVGIYV